MNLFMTKIRNNLGISSWWDVKGQGNARQGLIFSRKSI